MNNTAFFSMAWGMFVGVWWALFSMTDLATPEILIKAGLMAAGSVTVWIVWAIGNWLLSKRSLPNSDDDPDQQIPTLYQGEFKEHPDLVKAVGTELNKAYAVKEQRESNHKSESTHDTDTRS